MTHLGRIGFSSSSRLYRLRQKNAEQSPSRLQFSSDYRMVWFIRKFSHSYRKNLSPCPIRVGFWRFGVGFLNFIHLRKRRGGSHLPFSMFVFHLSFLIAEHPTLQSLPKLLSRRVLRITAAGTDELLSGINPPSQSGIEPESCDSLAWQPLGHRDPLSLAIHELEFQKLGEYFNFLSIYCVSNEERLVPWGSFFRFLETL